MTTENNTARIEQPNRNQDRELRDNELNTVTGGIIAILIGCRLTPSIPIPPPRG